MARTSPGGGPEVGSRAHTSTLDVPGRHHSRCPGAPRGCSGPAGRGCAGSRDTPGRTILSVARRRRSHRGPASRRRSPRTAVVPRPGRRRTGPLGLIIGVAAIAVFALGAFAIGGSPAASPTPLPSAGPSSSPAPTPPASPSPAPTPPPSPSPSPSPSGPVPIAGIPCEPGEQLVYHVHAHLAIRIRGVAEVVPTVIGLRETCVYWLHTHATSGLIHLEAPEEH